MLYLPLDFLAENKPRRVDTNCHGLHRCPHSWIVAAATGASVLHYRYAGHPFQVVIHWRCVPTPDEPLMPDTPIRHNAPYFESPFIDLDRQGEPRVFLRPEVALLDSNGMAVAANTLGHRLDTIMAAEPLWRLSALNSALWETGYGPTVDEL